MTEGNAPRPLRDAHTHLAAGAADLLDLDLRQARAGRELAAAVTHAASGRAVGTWIRGWGWDGVAVPADVAPRHPVFIARGDGHAAWINPAGRAALGIDPDAAVVSDASFDAARRLLPEHSSGQRMAALQPRFAELVAHNVGAIDDMVEPWAPEVYASLRDRRELPVAIGMWLPEDIEVSEAEAIRKSFPPEDPRLATQGIKIFLDGTLGAHTAALSSPYADRPETSGILRIPPGELNERVSRWAQRGWSVAIHAIGDRAVSLALDALSAAPRPPTGAHRIEHAQVVRRQDLARFAQAGIIASVQPGHWRDDRPWLDVRLGERPGVVAHPLGSLVRSGATVLFGSDWPVSDWDPAGILAAAIDPERGGEALDRPGAVSCYHGGRKLVD